MRLHDDKSIFCILFIQLRDKVALMKCFISSQEPAHIHCFTVHPLSAYMLHITTSKS